jgi:hypothetical protein
VGATLREQAPVDFIWRAHKRSDGVDGRDRAHPFGVSFLSFTATMCQPRRPLLRRLLSGRPQIGFPDRNAFAIGAEDQDPTRGPNFTRCGLALCFIEKLKVLCGALGQFFALLFRHGGAGLLSDGLNDLIIGLDRRRFGDAPPHSMRIKLRWEIELGVERMQTLQLAPAITGAG